MHMLKQRMHVLCFAGLWQFKLADIVTVPRKLEFASLSIIMKHFENVISSLKYDIAESFHIIV